MATITIRTKLIGGMLLLVSLDDEKISRLAEDLNALMGQFKV